MIYLAKIKAMKASELIGLLADAYEENGHAAPVSHLCSDCGVTVMRGKRCYDCHIRKKNGGARERMARLHASRAAQKKLSA